MNRALIAAVILGITGLEFAFPKPNGSDDNALPLFDTSPIAELRPREGADYSDASLIDRLVSLLRHG